MSELVSIFRSSEATGDVVFVHGLGGDAYETWGFPNNSCWRKCISVVRPDLNIWSLSYRVDVSDWAGGAMPLSDRAINVLALLDIRLSEDRPIIFVCHSLGGLLVKELLRNALTTTPKYRGLASKVKLIVFFATPHTGSSVADLAGYLGFFLRSSVAVSDLTAQNPRLRDLNLWFRNNFAALDLKTLIFFETKKTKGVHVVNESSADPGIAPISPIPIDADHLDIVKPEKYSDIVVGQTLKEFDEVLPSTKYHFRFDDISRIQNFEFKGEAKPSAWKSLFHRLDRRKALQAVLITLSLASVVFWLFHPSGGNAVLYTSEGRQYNGSTVWRYELMPPSPLAKDMREKATTVAAPVSVVRASIEIPDALTGDIVVQKAVSQQDKSSIFGGAHLIEFKLRVPAGFHGGAVDRIKSISTKKSEGDQPKELGAYYRSVCYRSPCPPNIPYVFVYLSDDPRVKSDNVRELDLAKFLEVSFEFTDGQSAVLLIGKNRTGDAVFTKALVDWGERPF